MFRELDGTYPERKKNNYSLDILKYKLIMQPSQKRYGVEPKLIGIFVISPKKEDSLKDFERRYELFKKGIDYYINQGNVYDCYTCVNPAPDDEPYYYRLGWNEINFLGESIKMLGKADLVVVDNDYEKDTKSIIEYEVATKYKMNIKKEDEL